MILFTSLSRRVELLFAIPMFFTGVTSSCGASAGPVPDQVAKTAQLFPLGEVHLLPGYIKDEQDRNSAYLLSLDPERFLYNFRFAAGLPTGAVKPYGGWENAKGFCRGHFTGHYLSACAESYAATGDTRFKDRCDTLVNGLAECQKAFGNGFLFTATPIVFEHLEHGTPIPKGTPTESVPFYTMHKILAGLLDANRFTGNAEALQVACRLGDWVSSQLSGCSGAELDKMFHTDHYVPGNEFGGMSEAMHNLYAVTGDPKYLKTAQLFDREWFLCPLSQDQDILSGLHANCHLPQVLGAARDFELTGKETNEAVAINVWHMVVPGRTFNNGGSSGMFAPNRKMTPFGEHWSAPDLLEATFAPKMAETCVAHNMLRLTSKLFTWKPSEEYAAYYERTFFNTVLGTIGALPGVYTYSIPLLPGSHKDFGTPENTFWCCYGTGVEAFAQVADPIYYHGKEDLWVNLLVGSELNWKERGLKLTQITTFPYNDRSSLTVTLAQPTDFTLHLFIPGWTIHPVITMNGTAVTAPLKPGSFVDIRQTWHSGDTIGVTFPMHLWTERLAPNSTKTAVFYGPVMLVGLTSTAFPGGPSATSEALLSQFKPDPLDDKLSFQATIGGTPITFKPLVFINDTSTAYTPYLDVNLSQTGKTGEH